MTAQTAVVARIAGKSGNKESRDQSSVSRAFDISIDRRVAAIWCTRLANAFPSISLAQLKETRMIDEKISAALFGPISFKVLSSRQSGVFSLGGDLGFFCDCIEARDRAALAEYAVMAAKAIWANLSGYNSRDVRTIAVVQGEAQGGGFEAALSCNTLIAERGTFFGFPEPLFGMFPGMGGEILLSTRVDADVSSKIVSSTNRYSAEFLHTVGVVDYLAEPGCGERTASELMSSIAEGVDSRASDKMAERQARLNTIRYETLANSIERWTDQAFRLTQRNLRSMRYILERQSRRES